ncbi:tyrosine-type recombinase/integrase [Sporosarcina koreensis]|uniref:tyrosine-type recombinase/integrase n=1 Tax=Sporosarcina koreensis TaxID=334735 RepID=UPI00059105B2|nr:tyrosine-type recombinase/integrase [Sporosarcina koreensis]
MCFLSDEPDIIGLYINQNLKVRVQKIIEYGIEVTTDVYVKNQLVFPNIENYLHEPNKTYQWLKRVLDKYLLEPITTHGLRHTHCSLLFEAGATIKEVQVRLGHKDVKTTLDVYAHVTKQAKASTIEKFNNYLSNLI